MRAALTRPAEAADLAGRARDAAARAGATDAGRRSPTSARPRGAGRVVGSLTARETEIAALVAAGPTNAQIAAALTISPKTVGAHVEHILTKLGAGRRAEIAAWYAAGARAAEPAAQPPRADNHAMR